MFTTRFMRKMRCASTKHHSFRNPFCHFQAPDECNNRAYNVEGIVGSGTEKYES